MSTQDRPTPRQRPRPAPDAGADPADPTPLASEPTPVARTAAPTPVTPGVSASLLKFLVRSAAKMHAWQLFASSHMALKPSASSVSNSIGGGGAGSGPPSRASIEHIPQMR